MQTRKTFAAYLDPGHGGIDPVSGKYVTPGKRAYHAGKTLHEGGHYYEGVENRLVAQEIYKKLTALGIAVFLTCQDYKDTPLAERARMVNKWEKEGFSGFLLSIHSNAVSEDNPNVERIQGISIWTTTGQSFSDAVAGIHLNHLREEYPAELPESYFRKDLRDGDTDFEENFQILRSVSCPAILEEGGFHTSAEDAERIINQRQARARAAVKTVLWVRDSFLSHGLA